MLAEVIHFEKKLPVEFVLIFDSTELGLAVPMVSHLLELVELGFDELVSDLS